MSARRSSGGARAHRQLPRPAGRAGRAGRGGRLPAGPSRRASARTRREQWLALTRPHAARPTATRLHAALRPGDRRAVSRRHARARGAPARPRCGQPTTAIRCPTLLLRGAESDLLSPRHRAAMTQRGPRARLRRVRRRRPRADARRSPTRSRRCGSSCSRHEDRRCRARQRTPRRSCSWPTRDADRALPDAGRAARRQATGRARARLRRAAARRPARSTPARTRWPTPTAWPRSCEASARRRRCRPRPTWSTPATT